MTSVFVPVTGISKKKLQLKSTDDHMIYTRGPPKGILLISIEATKYRWSTIEILNWASLYLQNMLFFFSYSHYWLYWKLALFNGAIAFPLTLTGSEEMNKR